MTRLLFVLAVAIACTAACGTRTLTRAPDQSFEFRIIEDAASLRQNSAELSTLIVCTDSLGRPMTADEGSQCTPCVPLPAMTNAGEATRHARRLWQQTANAPYNETDAASQCTRLSYEFALLADSTNRDIRVEHALFQLASAVDSVRAAGLITIDGVLDTMLRASDSAGAATVFERTGLFVWERAQRMRTRSSIIDEDDRETKAHDLRRGAPPLRRLPPLPRTSERLGTSEAMWAAQLFLASSALTAESAPRARRTRLALAPYVVLGDWRTLDSMALSILAASPRDSVAFPAHALASYELGKRSLANYVRLDAVFDSALSAMPVADSAAYDNVDDVFSAKDDEWRYGFLPGIREQLDRRAWAVVDPLWSTTINEMRLARRARKADADFRYADIAQAGQSGSETDAGTMLIKGGRPTPQWSTRFSGPNYLLQYRWSDFIHRVYLQRGTDTWRAFYGDQLTPDVVVRSAVDTNSCCPAPRMTLVQCVREQSARWNDVVFHARLDTIDVTLARFRTSNDSVDLYVGSRLPLRGFRFQGSENTSSRDSLEYGFWLASSLGRVLHHRSTTRALPRVGDIAWTNQWIERVGDGNIMHRVEAIDRRHARGARGAALLTSNEAALFHLNGFGVSDILVADRMTPKKPLLSSWRDLEITPNGGVVAPRVPIALAWEIYDLARGPDGRAQWRVQLRREDGTMLSRFDAQSLIVGSPDAGTQVVASEPSASQISYVRSEPARRAVVEFLRFNLTDAQPGRHVLVLDVEDLVARKTTSRSVSLRILPPLAQNRSSPGVAPAEFNGFQLIDGVRRRLPR